MSQDLRSGNLDRGLDIESASVLMGHATTNTTERFYSRMKLERAQDNLEKVWMANSTGSSDFGISG